jgi:hypothetical protein
MNESRPTVLPLVIANAVERAPERVRRRLDREPTAAAAWQWHCRELLWEVEAGGERIQLPRGCVERLEQVVCSCLLAPNCFHVLACLTSLAIAEEAAEASHDRDSLADGKAIPEERSVEIAARTAEGKSTLVAGESEWRELSDEQRLAASSLREAVEKLLRVGAAAAGVVIQSSVLRAAHACRAEGLPRAAELALRVVGGVGSYRARSADADPGQLADDVASLLETVHWLVGREQALVSWIGESRRSQYPVSPKRLHGLLAEPIVTRGGHAGAAAYLLGEDGRIYVAADVRPGEPSRARDAYQGGIEIGPLIEPANRLARGHYVVAEMTASRSGRLGRGQGARMAAQGNSRWEAGPIRARFDRPYRDQWQTVLRQLEQDGDDRAAGGDFVFVTGMVHGALGPELLFELAPCGTMVRLAIESEQPSLMFRENLRMLSYCPGLKLRLIGRMRLDDSARVYPLAIAPVVPESMSKTSFADPVDAAISGAAGERASDGAGLKSPAANEEGPRLELGDKLVDRVCLGFDELSRRCLPGALAKPRVLAEYGIGKQLVKSADDRLAALRRRWVSTLVAGVGAQRGGSGTTLQSEAATFARSGWETAAALIDALSRTGSQSDSAAAEVFLAVSVYLRACRSQWQLSHLPDFALNS